MKFNKKQIEFMRSLGLKFNFENLTDDDLFQLEDVVGEKLQRSGFDKNYDATAVGLMCESILDQLA